MHFDNWIWVLFLAMAALLKLLASKAGNTTNQSTPEQDSTPSPRRQPSPQRPAPASDEEQIRKFLEALGQPPTSKPPAPVSPRTDLPPRPVAPVQPPGGMFRGPAPLMKAQRRKRYEVIPQKPAATTEDWLRKINVSGPAVERTKETTTAISRPAESEVFEVRSQGGAEPEVPPPAQTSAEAYARATATAPAAQNAKTDLARLLATPSGLRNAMILREIFGPPRSLQPLADPVGFS